MPQALLHSHDDLIYLSVADNVLMDSMEHRKEIGKRIAALREAKGLTQTQLAESAHIKQPSLWAIEHGQTVEVTARTFIALCRALDTTWEYLWDGSEEDQDAISEAQLVAIFRQLEQPAKMAILQSAQTVRAALTPRPSGAVRFVKRLPTVAASKKKAR